MSKPLEEIAKEIEPTLNRLSHYRTGNLWTAQGQDRQRNKIVVRGDDIYSTLRKFMYEKRKRENQKSALNK